MGQMIQSVCELRPSETCDLPARHPGHGGPGAPLKRYLLDPVLPMLMLLSMSALTVVMLVAVVTAVADMDVRPADDYVTVDPWTGIPREATGAPYADQGVYVDSAAPTLRKEGLPDENPRW